MTNNPPFAWRRQIGNNVPFEHTVVARSANQHRFATFAARLNQLNDAEGGVDLACDIIVAFRDYVVAKMG